MKKQKLRDLDLYEEFKNYDNFSTSSQFVNCIYETFLRDAVKTGFFNGERLTRKELTFLTHLVDFFFDFK